MDNIKRKQLVLYGHAQRMKKSKLPRQVMEWVSVENEEGGGLKQHGKWEYGE